MFCAKEMFYAVATRETSQCEVTPSTFNELFARKYVTLNNEKGTESQGRLAIMMTNLIAGFSLINYL